MQDIWFLSKSIGFPSNFEVENIGTIKFRALPISLIQSWTGLFVEFWRADIEICQNQGWNPFQ
jgi:hypothetical protein